MSAAFVVHCAALLLRLSTIASAKLLLFHHMTKITLACDNNK